jgi:general secretion pathway protein A
MSVYRHFGLSTPPFERLPDPRFFYAAPSHEEALATLQYTVYANKGCCLVLGESGSGKTLLARMLCRLVSKRTTIVWIHGIGESDETPTVDVYAPGSFDKTGVGSPTDRTTLSAWSRSRSVEPAAPLLIIDNADELPGRAWRSIVAMLASEPADSRPPNVALFGLPGLKWLLPTPRLARLSRRVFRTYLLQPLTSAQAREYVYRHVAVAGGQGSEVFTNQAIAELHRLTGGNPGLINQVCDNAMIDAYGEDRHRIEAADVVVAVRTIGGGDFAGHGRAGQLTWDGLSPPALPPPVSPDGFPVAQANHGAGPGHAFQPRMYGSCLSTFLARASRRIVSASIEDAPVGGEWRLQRRLESLEDNLTRALEAVR